MFVTRAAQHGCCVVNVLTICLTPSFSASAVVNAGSMPIAGTLIVRGAAFVNTPAIAGPSADRSAVPPSTDGTITGVPDLTSNDASLAGVSRPAKAEEPIAAVMPSPSTTGTSAPPLETNVRFAAITDGNTGSDAVPTTRLIGAATAGAAIVVSACSTAASVTLGCTEATGKAMGADVDRYAARIAA